MWALFITVALLAVAACGGDSSEPEPQAPATPAPSGPSPQTVQPTSTPEPQVSASPVPSKLRVALASTDLSVGTNRVVFGLIDRQSQPLKNADVTVSTFYLTKAGQEGPIETVKAVFRRWPTSAAGVYTVQLAFDRPGSWGLGAEVVEADGTTRTSSVRLQVNETSATPVLGLPAPKSVSKAARNVELLDEMTTDPEPDPGLYAMTIAEAIDSGKPLLVAFATPAYCQTATCGPQLKVIKQLKQQYGDRVNFIHVEVFDNPLEIQGDLSRAKVSPTVTEWNLPSEPWTFIVDREGLVHSKFEGFATSDELEDALADVVR